MAISIGNLTANVATDASNVVTGTGIFDDMMETVNAHMAAQFNLGRITGSDYATVYLTAIQATVQQAVAFTIGAQKGNAEQSLLFQNKLLNLHKLIEKLKQLLPPLVLLVDKLLWQLNKLKVLNGMPIKNILKLFWMPGVLIFLQQV